MLGAATWPVLVLLLLASVVGRQVPLFALSLGLLLARALSAIWERYCLAGLEYRRRLCRTRVGFGEEIELEIEIVNRKILPLAWVQIDDEIPRALPPAAGWVRESHRPNRALLSSLIGLRPYERVRRRYRIPCLSRGEHLIGPVRIRTGDLLGLTWREVELDHLDTLVVTPRVIPVAAVLPARRPLGDRRTRSWLFEDVSRIAGAREYRPEDSPRRIHWPATARSQRLQVKVFEPTASERLMVLVDLASVPALGPGPRIDRAVLELTLAAAASIVAWGLAAGHEVGLGTNGVHRGSLGRVRADPSRAPAQLPRLLEMLGRLGPLPPRPFEATLAEEVRRMTFGTTVVVLAAELGPRAMAQLQQVRRRGHAVRVLLTGRRPSTASPGGPRLERIGPPEAWPELAALSLGGA
jgi:uncharacterized protein (DUF58 family)